MRTFVTVGRNIRLYNDGCIRVWLGDGATAGNGSDVAPGETVLRRSRVDVASFSEADLATWNAWTREQDAYPR